MTTRTTLKRMATATAIAGATLTGTLGIATVNAGSAAAAVDNGRYTLTTISYGIFPVCPRTSRCGATRSTATAPRRCG